jgi:hypothetical protein
MNVRYVGAVCVLMAGLVLSAGASAQVATDQSAGKAAGPVASDLQADIERALFSAAGFDGLTVKAQKTANGLWVLTVAPSGVGWNSGTTDTFEHSEATVAVGWFDAAGKLMGNLAQEQNFRRTIPGGDAVYSMHVEVPAGAVRVRFVVRDALNRHMGTVDLTQW